MDVYGQLIRAQLENRTTDQANFKGMVYFNTSTSKAKIYDGTSWKNLVTEDGTQTLTNKTVTAALVSNYLDFTESSAPSTPSSGTGRIYVSTTGKFKFVNDDGLTKTLGDAGSGEINVITDSSDATNWAASGAGITVGTTSTSSDLPLSGVIETAIKITPVSSTDYVRYRWTQPAALKNRKLKLQWDQRPLSGYATGDLKVEIYKNAASNYGGAYTEFALSTDSSGTSSIPNLTGRYVTTFDADDADYYELRIVRTAGTTALNIASVIVGPGVQPQGAIVADAVSWTPTGSWSSNTTYAGKYRRVGAWSHFEVDITLSGAPTSAQLSVNLPSGMTIDTSALASGGDSTDYGLGLCTIVDSGTVYLGRVRYNSTTAVYIEVETASGSYVQRDSVTQAVPFTFGNGDEIHIKFAVPIAEWAGGTVNLAQNDVMYGANSSVADSNDTSSFIYGPAGTAIQTASLTGARTRLVRFPRPVQNAKIQVSPDQINWIDFTQIDVNITGTGRFHNLDEANSIGFGISSVSGTDVTVEFMQYRTTGSANWTTGMGYWRVVATASGQAVGFSNASATDYGLVKASEGSWTPTFSNLSGVDAVTAVKATYMQLGNHVECTMRFNAGTAGEFGNGDSFNFTLPIDPDSNFTNVYDLNGMGISLQTNVTEAHVQTVTASTGGKLGLVTARGGNPAANINHIVKFAYKLR